MIGTHPPAIPFLGAFESTYQPDQAAGLAVSARVRDVVADHAGTLELRDDGVGLAEACMQAADESREALAERVRSILHAQHRDATAEPMPLLLDEARRGTASRATA